MVCASPVKLEIVPSCSVRKIEVIWPVALSSVTIRSCFSGLSGMGRAVRKQQHARQRPALTLLAMLSAQGGLAHQPRRLTGAKGGTV